MVRAAAVAVVPNGPTAHLLDYFLRRPDERHPSPGAPTGRAFRVPRPASRTKQGDCVRRFAERLGDLGGALEIDRALGLEQPGRPLRRPAACWRYT